MDLAAKAEPVELLGFAKNRLNKFYNPNVSVEKVIKMVDGMVVLLGEEQEADDVDPEKATEESKESTTPLGDEIAASILNKLYKPKMYKAPPTEQRCHRHD